MKVRSPRLLQLACILSLVSFALIAWGIIVPMPVPVIFAMSMGQGLGTVAVVLFAIVVLRDLKPRMLAPSQALETVSTKPEDSDSPAGAASGVGEVPPPPANAPKAEAGEHEP